MTGESLEGIEASALLEGFSIQLDGRVRGEHAGAPAGILLGAALVRRTVGAEEEARIAAGGRIEQRLAILLALENRQTIIMRPNAAGEDRVAVVQQVLGGDGGRHARACAADELRRLRRGDVFEDDFQGGKALNDGREHGIDEMVLPIEYVDVGTWCLAVHEQGNPEFRHTCQRGIGTADVGYAGVRVSGRTGGIEFDAVHEA
jgi:hypothetical protein